MSNETRAEIEKTLAEHRIVLYMKGTRSFPQCGFSATVVQILNELVPDQFHTVNVLADPAVRDGIKAFADWPTIPQLYVGGELVGGCDIVRDLHASGELAKTLGVAVGAVSPPRITVTPAAARTLQAARADTEAGDGLHVTVSPTWEHGLDLGPRADGDLAVESAGLTLLVAPGLARKLDGLVIDYVEGPDATGFRLDNPNAPAQVRRITAKELKAKLDVGPIELYDVRTDKERAVARIEGARLLDDEAKAHLEALDKATPLYFHCHHGQRSQRAAQHFLGLGFREVHDLVGGIDAWSLEVDPGVKRY
jgi:monothiol glutaredoxin